MIYNPFSGYWHWSENTSLNYAAHAVKQEHPVPAGLVVKGETEDCQANDSTSPAVHEELKKWIVAKDWSDMAWKPDVYKYKKYTV